METERITLSQRERDRLKVLREVRGRPSNRKLAARFEQKILTRVGQRYADFGPTLAAEHLAFPREPGVREALGPVPRANACLDN